MVWSQANYDQVRRYSLNVFTQQGGKDKKTGDQFADRDKVQILGAMDLPNGDVKMNYLRYL